MWRLELDFASPKMHKITLTKARSFIFPGEPPRTNLFLWPHLHRSPEVFSHKIIRSFYLITMYSWLSHEMVSAVDFLLYGSHQIAVY